MRLIANCKNCFEKLEFNEIVSDRSELSFEKGNKIQLSCSKCFARRNYHPNEISGEKSKISIVLGYLLFITISILIVVFFWKFYHENFTYLETKNDFTLLKQLLSIICIPFVIYTLIMKIEAKKVNRFNSYKIKE